MTLTKNQLVNSIRERLGLSKSNSVTLFESLLTLIKSTLESGEDVLISGFGKFCVKDKNERKGRNPYTRNDVILDARRVVTFKYSDVLRDKINSKG